MFLVSTLKSKKRTPGLNHKIVSMNQQRLYLLPKYNLQKKKIKLDCEYLSNLFTSLMRKLIRWQSWLEAELEEQELCSLPERVF